MLGGIALGMSLLPEEFPLVLACSWRWRMAYFTGPILTRRASAIEALGATTVLCTTRRHTDRNRMTIVSILSEDARCIRRKDAGS